MINDIRFKIIAGKLDKIPEFYTILPEKMPDYIIRKEAKSLRPRPIFGVGRRGHFGLEDFTGAHPRALRKQKHTCIVGELNVF